MVYPPYNHYYVQTCFYAEPIQTLHMVSPLHCKMFNKKPSCH